METGGGGAGGGGGGWTRAGPPRKQSVEGRGVVVAISSQSVDSSRRLAVARSLHGPPRSDLEMADLGWAQLIRSARARHPTYPYSYLLPQRHDFYSNKLTPLLLGILSPRRRLMLAVCAPARRSLADGSTGSPEVGVGAPWWRVARVSSFNSRIVLGSQNYYLRDLSQLLWVRPGPCNIDQRSRPSAQYTVLQSSFKMWRSVIQR